ncbi:hypothetical protein TSUD_10200 [Trifolium subterraneum]|nr:hypothetical protein TSUD_10200 [Trifolium subterraneum]
MRGSMNLIPVSFPNCETGSGSGSHEPKLWHFLPPPPEFPPKRIPPPPEFSSGFKSPLERESSPPQMRDSMGLIPTSFPDCEIKSEPREQEFRHYLPPPSGFQPKKISPPPKFSGNEHGSVGLIPSTFPDCETESESREQEFWHFLPPPPGFKPKKIPPPLGFTGKEYN